MPDNTPPYVFVYELSWVRLADECDTRTEFATDG